MSTAHHIKAPKEPIRINKTDVLIDHYLAQGLTVTKAAEKVGISRTQASLIKSKLAKYKCSNPKAVKKSMLAFDKVLDDFLLEKDNVKSSDAVALVKMIQDRIDPIKGNDTQNTVNFTVVNLALISPTQDIVIPVNDNNVSDNKANNDNDLQDIAMTANGHYVKLLEDQETEPLTSPSE